MALCAARVSMQKPAHSNFSLSKISPIIRWYFDVNRKRKAIEKALGGDGPLFISETPMFMDDDIVKKLYGL